MKIRKIKYLEKPQLPKTNNESNYLMNDDDFFKYEV